MLGSLRSSSTPAHLIDALVGSLARAIANGELPAATESVILEVRWEGDEVVTSVLDPSSSRAWITRIPGKGLPRTPVREVLRLSGIATLLSLYGVSLPRVADPAANLPLTKIEPKWKLSEIVLDAPLRQSLDVFISVAANGRAALSAAGSLAKGVSSICALMVGPPGVGKSICAEAVAQALGRPLVRVRASDIESKYAGETQKNIKGIFEYARANGVVLFFDEAESLVCRLRAMASAQDKYASSVRAEILLSLDAHEGPVLFASNWDSFDAAFVRRCLYVLELTLPDRGLLRAFLSSLLENGARTTLGGEQLDQIADHLSEMKASFASTRSILLRAHLRAHASEQPMTYDAVMKECAVTSSALARVTP